MAAHHAAARVGRERPAGKHPEPTPLPARVRVLAIKGIRHPHTGEARLAVNVVQRFGLAQLRSQLVSAGLGQERRSVLVALPCSHEYEALVEVDVLHPEFATLRHTQPSAVDEPGHNSWYASHGGQQGGCFRDAQDDGQALSTLGPRREREPLRVQPQHFTAQEQDRAHRLVLRARRDPPVYRQVRQIVANRFGVNLRLGAALLADEVLEEAARPVHIAALGSIG